MIGARMSMRSAAGFTILELIVVIAIMVILFAIGFGGMTRDERSVRVKAEADRLAAVLQRARNMALRQQTSYGVAFHVQNAPGSSGEVLNNRSGGHWYRIVGPANTPWGRVDESGRIPWLGALEDHIGGSAAPYAWFPALVDTVRSSWASEPYVLPARRVRFLALSDLDEGPRVHDRNPNGSDNRFYGVSPSKSYPRPWFGYFDPTTLKLRPWGGYRSDEPTSGFHYEGSGPAVVGCRNPSNRTVTADLRRDTGTTDLDLNGDGDTSDPFEQEVNYPVLRQDDPRPLVNGDWLDVCVVFLPNGQVLMQEWARNRRWFSLAEGGVQDMTRLPVQDNRTDSAVGAPYAYWAGTKYFHDARVGVGNHPYDCPPMVHFVEHTGGWFITLAPDVDTDQVDFPTAMEAIRSMLPLYRIFVSSGGAVKVVAVDHRERALDGRTVWPSTSNLWDATTTNTANPIWQNCRKGYLHVANGDAIVNMNAYLRPRGQPITDMVNTQMMTNRVWWLDE